MLRGRLPRSVGMVGVDFGSGLGHIPRMSDEFAFRTSWRVPNLLAFLCAHGLFFFGLRATLGDAPALGISIAVGLMAWWSWMNRPRWWSRARLGIAFLVVAVLEAVLFAKLDVPEPEPEPFMVVRDSAGIWHFNRGDPRYIDRVFLAMPEKEERLERPHILGAFRVTGRENARASRVEWLVLRRGYRDRRRFPVRSLMNGEKVPGPADLATLIDVLDDRRARIDVGAKAGVKEGDAYALFHPAGPGTAGYLVIDHVNDETADGYLVDAKPIAPQDLTHLGSVKQLILISNSRGELAWRAQRWSDAEKHYRHTLALSRGRDPIARERLSLLQKKKDPRKMGSGEDAR